MCNDTVMSQEDFVITQALLLYNEEVTNKKIKEKLVLYLIMHDSHA